MKIEQTINSIVVDLVFEEKVVLGRAPMDHVFKAYVNRDVLPKDYQTNIAKDPRSYYLVAVPGRDNACDIIHSIKGGSIIKTIRVVEQSIGVFTYGSKGEGNNDYDSGFCARTYSMQRVIEQCQLEPASNWASTYAADDRLKYKKGW